VTVEEALPHIVRRPQQALHWSARPSAAYVTRQECHAMLISMQKHSLNPDERRLDHRTPDAPQIGAVRVTRGRANPPGVWVEDSDIGSIVIDLTAPADDRTPADSMGYRIRYAGGRLPGANLIPSDDVRALVRPDGTRYLVLYWGDGATNTQDAFQLILSIAAVDLGGNVGPCVCVAVGDPAPARPPRDEIEYDPRALRIVNEGASGWVLTDGRSRMVLFDNEQDARNGLAVAQRYRRQGFVGRDNHRPNRKDYLFFYWAGDSGLTHAPLTTIDAIPFDPNHTIAVDRGALGWQIQDGASMLELADDAGDAAAMLTVIKRHSRVCFIGRSNRRPNRKDYIMTYWE